MEKSVISHFKGRTVTDNMSRQESNPAVILTARHTSKKKYILQCNFECVANDSEVKLSFITASCSPIRKHLVLYSIHNLFQHHTDNTVVYVNSLVVDSCLILIILHLASSYFFT